MSNVLDNLGRIKVVLGSSSDGAWPLPDKVNIGATEYSTIGTAIAAAAVGDTLYAVGDFTENVTINKAIRLVGLGLGAFTITGTVTISDAGAVFENCTVTGRVSLSAGATIINIIASESGGTDSRGISITGNNATLINCQGTASGASTTNFGLYVNATGVRVIRGDYAATGTGNIDIKVDGGNSITAADTFVSNIGTTVGIIYGSLRVKSTAFIEIPPSGQVIFDAGAGLYLSGSGGTGQYLKQLTLNGVVSVGTIPAADLLAIGDSLSGYKNLLYSSLCHDLWQEGTTLNDLADDTYGPDTVWNVLNKSNAPDISGQAGGASDPFTRSFRCTFDAANEQAGIVEFLEAEDTYPLRGQIVSLSADLWGTNVGTLRMAVIEWTSTADALTSDVVGTWGTGNPTLATNWAYIGTPAAITISGTRTRYKVENLTVGASANNLGVFIWTDANEGSGDLWNVARVQLEIGPVATAFQARPFGVEYELVSRFWLKSYALATAPGTATNVNREAYQTRRALAGTTAGTPLIETVMFPYRMRTAPTVVLYSTSTGTANAIFNNNAAADRTGCTAGSVGDNRFGQVDADNTSATAIALDQALSFHYTASARL